ncbi:CIR protein, partial [Plasmodium chabaudi chabaudi]
MDHKLMCKYLNIADSYFKGENVNTTKINKDLTINGFCNNGVCKTNEAGINALAAYIFKQFKVSIGANEYNKYDEYLLMWLSDKLFKIHDKSEEKDNKITLNKAYDTYLKNHKVKFDYWIFLDMQQGLKEANLRYMSEFYKLLDKICKTITDYEKKRDEITNHITNSTECSNQYISIYNDIPKCKSYLDLLNKLKGIYDDFRNYAIKNNSSNNELETKLKKLTKPDGGEMDAVRGYKSYKFSASKCKSLDKKITMSKPTDPSGLPRSSEEVQPPPKEPSSDQKGSGGDKEKHKNAQSDLKGHNQTSVTNIGGSDDVTGGGSEDSNDGKGDKDKGELNTDGGQDDKEGSGSEQGGPDSAPVEEETQSTPGDPFNTGSFILSVSLQGMEKLNDAITSFEMIKERITESTDTIKKLYSTSLTNLENTYYKYSNFFKEIINSINTDSNEVDSPGDSDDNQSGSGGEEDEQSPPQKDSPQTSSGIQNSDKSDQGVEKPAEDQVIKSENPGTETKGNGTIGIGDIFIFKEYKKIGIPIIVIIISITLAIMYK